MHLQALALHKISLDSQIKVKLIFRPRTKEETNNLKHFTYHGFESDEKNHKKKLKYVEKVCLFRQQFSVLGSPPSSKSAQVAQVSVHYDSAHSVLHQSV